MEYRVVDAGRGWSWITEGFALFRKSPLIWILLFILFAVINGALGYVPVLGAIAVYLLYPPLIVGFVIGCRAQDAGGELEVGHLLEGFRGDLTPLLAVGGLYLAGTFLIVVLLLVGFGASALTALLSAGSSPAGLAIGLGSALIMLLVALALSIPLVMGVWFAPMLVAFNKAPPVAAYKLSFSACLGNWLPFLVYGLALLILVFIAAIPFGLGFLVLGPTAIASLHTSFKDIFGAAAGPA
jgi:hypothetical protein